jgi:flagellin-like hook-associated protein FlgL
MDPGALGVLVPVAAIAAWASIKIASIQARSRAAGADPEAANRLQSLENEVGSLRSELGEVHERLDFAERLLAQRPPDRLDPPQ